MAHQHAKAHHLVRRQRNAVETVVAVEIVTMPNTFTGKVQWVTQQDDPPPRTLVPPAVRPRPSTTEEDEPEEATTRATTTRRPAASTTATTATTTASSERTTQSSSAREQSTLVVATKSPTAAAPVSSAIGLVSAAASATISATPTASSSAAAQNEGMSGGAKAGLALGILLGVAALLVGILMFYRHKKSKMAGEDNEKIGMHSAPPPPPPQVQTGAAPAASSTRSPATAPRLSLRPESQFSPTFNEQRKSGGNVLNAAAAAGAMAQTKKLAPSPEERPTSAWERRGATNASADPFNDESVALSAIPRPQQNPFGNSAALDATHASIPDSPPNASPVHSTSASADLAKSTAESSANLNAAALGTAASAPVISTQDLPLPPSVNANADGVPASPAWTDDIPASPGPAPTGPPPPVAAAMTGGRPNGPSGPNNVHRVTLDFKPSMGDELELKAGSLVRMLHEYDDGWALCITMDRSQQGVVPRTCVSKHPVKPRTGPPRQGPPPPHMRGNPPIRSPMGPGGIPQPRPMSPAEGPSHPAALSPANGRMSPGPRTMSPGPHQMASHQMQQGPRGRSNSNAPYARPQRSMSPGPYGGGPQMAPPSQMGRPRSNSANQATGARRGPAPGPSPMNPNTPMVGVVPSRKPVPGMAL